MASQEAVRPHPSGQAPVPFRSRIGAALALLIPFAAAGAAPVPPAPGPDTARIYAASNYARPYVPGEIIVSLKPGYASLSVPGSAPAKGLRLVRRLAAARDPSSRAPSAAGRGLLLMRSEGPESVPALIAALRKDAGVAFAEPNYVRRLLAVPDDSLFESQWGLHNIGRYPAWGDADIDAPEAWNWQTGGRSLVLGVIDDGVDYAHPDLAANIWTNAAEAGGRSGVDDDGNGYVDDVHGYDFIGGDPDPMPDGGSHGTHVAGTIAAVGDNGKGVAGVAWKASMAALKVFDSAGTTTDAALIDAIDYANAMGMRITNNSWGGGAYSQALYDAIARGRDLGHLFIAAAGNDSADTDAKPEYPASYDLANIVSVAATTDADSLAVFSDYGAVTVDLGAPGQAIFSTLPGNAYGLMSGTSMAAPHVAGAAYLVWNHRTSLTAGQVKDILLRSVDPLPALAGKTVTGGRLNLAKAAAAASPPAVSLSPGRLLVRVDPGASALRDLELVNTGASDLRYVLSVARGSGWLSAAAAKPGSPTGTPFSDGFENGNWGNWFPASGSYARAVTGATAASGSFSFSLAGGQDAEYDGVYAVFPAGTAPSSVSFAVRSAGTGADAGYFTMADADGISISAHLSAGGRVRVNGDQSRAYQAGRWYAIRFRIDWSARVFDYFLDDTLVAQGLPFRNPSSSVSAIYLYNRTPGAQAWYDDIAIANQGSAPIEGVLPPASRSLLPIAFDAAGLPQGAYSGSLRLRHNAPNANDPIAVPCSLIIGYDRPPAAEAGPDRSGSEGQALSFSVSASDPDGDSVQVSLLNPPAGASFAGGTLAWTPGYDQAGIHDLRFQAQSGRPALSDTDTVRVEVRNVDRPPVLEYIGDRAVAEGGTLSFTVTASDPDGDPVAVSVPAPPPGAVFDAASGLFRWSPGHADSGSHPVLFKVSAGGLSDSEWVRIAVADVDRPPELAPVPAQAADENQRIAFAVAASDPDGDPIAIALRDAPAGASFASGRFAWVPGYAQSGTYRLRFIAASRGLADTLIVDVEVRDAGSGLGTLRLLAARPGTRFHFMPAGGQDGSYLGADSVDLAGPPGWYWIQASAPGHRSRRFAAAVRMDQVETRRLALRPAAPRVLSRPETLLVDGRPYYPPDSAAPALADLDLDGKEDLIAAFREGVEFHAGLDPDSAGGRRFAASKRIGFAPDVLAGLEAAAFADWDADGAYDLIGGDASGRVFVSGMNDTVFTGRTVLLSRPGERCHPFVLDYDGDGRKDLGIRSAGKGLFFYRNEGTEAAPVLSASAWELTDREGGGLAGLEGPPAWMALRGGPAREFLAPQGGRMKRFEAPSSADGRLALGKREDANLAGSPFACPGCRCAGTAGEKDRPRLVCFEKGKPALAYAGRLAGDFDGNGRVDGRDYALLAQAWGLMDGDPAWNPFLNLALDPAGERIDVRDLGILGDAWESEE